VEPVTLLINNSGGDDYNCLAIFDAIKQSPLHVTGLVRGSAMSAASIVLQACDWRKMGPLATQLVHYGSFGYQGHALDAQRAIDEGKRVNEWMENMYLARVREKQPDYALEKLRELLRFDSYLTAEQSVALGLADEVS
jgi:ATP-dependent protease ClpP protease subunit